MYFNFYPLGISCTHVAPRGQGEEEECGEEEEDVEAGERREDVHEVPLQLDVAVVQHADRRGVAKQAAKRKYIK